MQNTSNTVTATGRLEAPLQVDHVILGEPFYTGMLRIKRLSGNIDSVPVTVPGKVLDSFAGDIEQPIKITGQVRTYNKIIDGESRLVVVIFAQELDAAHDADTLNRVELSGAVCKAPIFRSTPFGREICDMMLAVNRGFGKSDYIPCIAWGRNAKWSAKLNLGDRVTINGRLQSRDYQKTLPNGECVTKTAYEVSTFAIERSKEEVVV